MLYCGKNKGEAERIRDGCAGMLPVQKGIVIGIPRWSEANAVNAVVMKIPESENQKKNRI